MKHPHSPCLLHDLEAMRRRRLLRWLSVAGAAPAALLGCGGGGDDGAGTTTTTTTTGGSGSTGSTGGTGSTGSGGTTTTSCSVIPSETEGPYPADGTNANASGTVNALTLAGIVRSDIRGSVAGASGTAQGVPTTVTLKLVDSASGCASLAGYAIYLWHCTREGGYSLYSSGVTSENFLRGVQVTDADGEVTFTTIFPGCYSGRWPHMHFEVYSSLSAATSGRNDVKTSQLALPAAACSQVYGVVAGYSASASNFAAISLASDNVFSDGYTTQLATVSGDASSGFAATLTVGITT
ncbi:intradiol ring-cleavage dioxygenase [Piscinibacter sp.]|uniref:dioxygenase family protein n=1 Tax=Piscinibacter sp. TaxID=1903157 RepID=UPI0039E6A05B